MQREQNPVITLAHGNGGKLTHDLISSVFLPCFNNPVLSELSDSALLNVHGQKLAFSTDSYVVKPLFFPGGNIGTLAVAGTVNDLSVTGARPQFLSASFIIEDGFPINSLKKIAESMAHTAESAGISIVTGDTKVVENGKIDGLFITTSGIGYFPDTFQPFSPDLIQPGDDVIINGTIGDHGIAILAARKDFPISTHLESDCAPLYHLIDRIVTSVPPGSIRLMRDPTRGGLGTTLNEFVQGKPFGILIQEEVIPIKNEVQVICEMTGYDPLYIANEGKVIIVASPEVSTTIVSLLKNHPLGKNTGIIGKVMDRLKGKVVMKTKIGGERIVDMLAGDMFPRIC
ncbi:MAG: hydrogenase expression/formation protein HypE [Spirochaetales bacterium]|nr:hydrogenase expression/formation protein HypE [Spirochaetales bacterium]